MSLIPTVTLNNGMTMPQLGLGTWSLRGQACKDAICAALKCGIRLFDSATFYGNEQEVGQALREAMAAGEVTRDELFVMTKLYPNEFRHAKKAFDASFQRLGLDYVDLVLLHHPGAGDVQAYQVLEQEVKQGTVKALGLSNFYHEELPSFLSQVSIKPVLDQNEIHPFYQEQDVVPFIQEQGLVVQAWYPFGGRGHTHEILNHPVITAIATKHGKTSAQVVLRWLLQRGIVVVPGSTNPEHMAQNCALWDFALDEAEMQAIRSLDCGRKFDWY